MLHLPYNLAATSEIPAADGGEGLVAEYPRGAWGERRGLKVLLLNLMPEKLVTERDIVRMLRGAGQDIVLVPLKINGQTYKTTPMAHMQAFYTDFEAVEGERWDGLIVTGAPVEHLPFEEVRYWPQLCRIMDWAERNVSSTLYICWAAQAALYHRHGVPKYPLAAKRFGIYTYTADAAATPVLQCFAPTLRMPTSRHTEVRADDIARHNALRIVSASDDAGVGIVAEEAGRTVYVTGHLEYAAGRLGFEYRRDVAKGRPIEPPVGYYRPGTDEPDFTWRDDALRFYHNWINHLVKPHSNPMDTQKTNAQFEAAMQGCRDTFVKKLHDYGAAWRILRPESVTDQIYIKANRIRGVQMKGHAEVEGEDFAGDFAAIVNYSIVGLIQLELGSGDERDTDAATATALYDKYAAEALALMKRKNHDYDEAWRAMRVSSYTDLILMKVFRTKQIEDLGGKTLVSEGVAANYMDMLNYSVFALIKLSEQQ